MNPARNYKFGFENRMHKFQVILETRNLEFEIQLQEFQARNWKLEIQDFWMHTSQTRN